MSSMLSKPGLHEMQPLKLEDHEARLDRDSDGLSDFGEWKSQKSGEKEQRMQNIQE